MRRHGYVSTELCVQTVVRTAYDIAWHCSMSWDVLHWRYIFSIKIHQNNTVQWEKNILHILYKSPQRVCILYPADSFSVNVCPGIIVLVGRCLAWGTVSRSL